MIPAPPTLKYESRGPSGLAVRNSRWICIFGEEAPNVARRTALVLSVNPELVQRRPPTLTDSKVCPKPGRRILPAGHCSGWAGAPQSGSGFLETCKGPRPWRQRISQQTSPMRFKAEELGDDDLLLVRLDGNAKASRGSTRIRARIWSRPRQAGRLSRTSSARPRSSPSTWPAASRASSTASSAASARARATTPSPPTASRWCRSSGC